MPGGIRKRWHFELALGGIKGIQINRGGKLITDNKGKPMGSVKWLSTPQTPKNLEQAKAFADQALQVFSYFVR